LLVEYRAHDIREQPWAGALLSFSSILQRKTHRAAPSNYWHNSRPQPA
jgi:hypothetical protein